MKKSKPPGRVKEKKTVSVENNASHTSLKRHAVSMAIVILAGIAAYSNSVHGPFHYDDVLSIVENPTIGSLNPAKIWTGNNRFRFVGFYSFALNRYCNGLDTVRGWHYVNIGLHIICALLLYLVLTLLAQDVCQQESTMPLMAGLLFAVHPLCSEPVNYIQARHVLFYSMFALVSVLSSSMFVRAGTRRHKALALIGIAASIVLGSLSKEVGMFYMPAAIAVYLVVIEGIRADVRRLARITMAVGFAATAILIVAKMKFLLMIFQPRYGPEGGEITFVTGLVTQAQVFWRYLSLTIPSASRLNVDHYVRVVSLTTAGQKVMAGIPILCMAASIAAALLVRRKKPIPSFHLLWVFMGVLPYMPAVLTSELMVEYKMYLPAMGLMGLVAWCVDQFNGFIAHKSSVRFAHLAVGMVFCTLAIFCIGETRARNMVWASKLTLWGDAVKKSPQKSRPHYGLGVAFAEQGRFDEAVVHYSEALRLKPDDAEAYKARNNLGIALAEQGKLDEAIANFSESLRINSNYMEARNNKGNALAKQGRLDEAVAQLSEVLRIKPDSAMAHNNMGAALEMQGKLKEAIAHYSEAIRIKPDYAQAHDNLGRAVASQGRLDEAIDHYSRALRINPDLSSARSHLLEAWRQTGRTEGVKRIEGSERWSD